MTEDHLVILCCQHIRNELIGNLIASYKWLLIGIFCVFIIVVSSWPVNEFCERDKAKQQVIRNGHSVPGY